MCRNVLAPVLVPTMVYILTLVGPVGATYVPLDFIREFVAVLDAGLGLLSPPEQFDLLLQLLYHFPDPYDSALARYQWGWRHRSIVLCAILDVLHQRLHSVWYLF